MLLRLLKSSSKAGYVALFLLLPALWHQQIVAPGGYEFAPGEEQTVLYSLVHRWLADNSLSSLIITLALLLVNSFVLVRIYRYYLFPGSRSLLPAVLFVLMTGGLPAYHSLHPVWLAVPFLLLALHRLFASFDVSKPYGNVFDAGLLLGVGSLFYLPLLTLLPSFVMGGRLLARDAKWREMVLVFIGTLVPWIFAFSLFFLLDKSGDILHSVSTNVITDRKALSAGIPLYLFLVVTGVLTLAGSSRMIRQYDEKKVNFRMFYLIFFLLFVSLVGAYFAVPAVSSEIVIIAAVPVTFLLANYFESIKGGWWGNAVFILLVVVVILLQYAGEMSHGLSVPTVFPW